jgi:outer membrane protein, heavy metal efflux system
MSRCLFWPMLLGCIAMALPGCAYDNQDHVASSVAQHLASLPRDLQAQAVLGTPKPQETPPVKAPQERLTLPEGLPGGNAAPIVVPPIDPNKAVDPERDRAVQAAYPQPPALDEDLKAGPGPAGHPLDLPALQQIALANNPLVQQAAADVQAARGAAIQAGLYPNPVAGFEGDSIGQGGTNGQLGGFVDQTIKTAGKLQLARSAGGMDVRIAELALRRTQVDVMAQVRSGYFAVVVAQENLAIAKAMALLSNEVYGLQVKMVQGGQAAPYEPLQLHVLAVQAKDSLVQARNRYLSAWRQLAASMGQPDMPPTQLLGRADVLPPGYAYDVIRDHMLVHHTDIAIANAGILKSRILLQLANVTPIPDINTHLVVQNDNTNNPSRVQAGVAIGVAIPIWDRNQGNILQAQAQLAKANREVFRVQTDLSQRLADAYERYRNNITLAGDYRDSILPNQVRVYRAIYQRYQQQPGQVTYSDIVVAQQTLAQALQTYVQNLAAQWQAVTDLATLLQTDDIYQLSVPADNCSVPPLPVWMMLDPKTWTTPGNETHRAQASDVQQTPAPTRLTLAAPR